MEQFTVTAPTRADLAGGTLDLWPLYCLAGSSKTINIALDLYATVRFETENASRFHVDVENGYAGTYSFEKPLTLEQASQLAPPHRFPVAVLSAYFAQGRALPDKKIKVRWETQAPLGSGLGGSSTLCIALLRGVSRLFGDFSDQGWQWKMQAWARDIEASFLKMPTGTQDYLASLFGGLNAFVSDTGVQDRRGYPDGVFESLAERTLILFSGEQHHSGMSNWELFKGAIDGDKSVLQGIHAIRQIADSLDGELRAGHLAWKHIGRLVSEEWKLRKELFRVHTDRLDEIIGFVTRQPVLGAKVCGAAQGGSLLVLVEPEHREAVSRACTEKGIQVLATRPTKKGVSVL